MMGGGPVDRLRLPSAGGHRSVPGGRFCVRVWLRARSRSANGSSPLSTLCPGAATGETVSLHLRRHYATRRSAATAIEIDRNRPKSCLATEIQCSHNPKVAGSNPAPDSHPRPGRGTTLVPDASSGASDASRAGTHGTHGTRPDGYGSRVRRLGAERSPVQIRPPRFSGSPLLKRTSREPDRSVRLIPPRLVPQTIRFPLAPLCQVNRPGEEAQGKIVES
jgi:hypothetical protein